MNGLVVECIVWFFVGVAMTGSSIFIANSINRR